MIRLAVMVMLWTGAALAQTDGGFTVEPLPELPAPGEGGGLTITLDPNMGLQETDTADPDSGFVLGGDNGAFVQINPGGQDGVALAQRPNNQAVTSVAIPAAAVATGAMLRALDKTVGERTDIEMATGEVVVFGRIAIRLAECRYPVDNPASDAFAHLQIADLNGQTLFDGWMVASSPALMALEHPRYDVWVLSCTAT